MITNASGAGRSLVLMVLALGVVPGLVWGATRVEYAAPPGLPFMAGPEGVALPVGNAVRLGYFDGGIDVVAAAAHDFAALDAAWHLYAETTIGSHDEEAGRFDVFAERSDAGFNGRKAYLWVFQTADASLPAADYSNVEAHGLFSGEGWIFPTLGALPTDSTLTVNTGTTARGVKESPLGVIESTRLRLVRVSGAEPGLTYVEWRTDPSTFPAGTLEYDKRWEADPDGDGLTNGEEFFHGLIPGVSNPSPVEGALVVQGGAVFYEIVFSRRRGIEGINVQLEVAKVLTDWQPVMPDAQFSAELDENRESVRLRVRPSAGADRFFVRIRVGQIE